MVASFTTRDVMAAVGTCQHVAAWLLSGFSDKVYENPKFKKGMTGVAVYFFFGTADRIGAFDYIAKYILDADWKLSEKISSIHLLTFDHRFEGIPIESIAEQAKDKMVANQDTNVIVAGHSRGGLVAAYLTAYLAIHNKITVYRTICLGSPFLGASLATYPLTVFSESIKQMAYGSKFLKELNEKIKDSRDFRYLAAENDELVSEDACCPPEHKEFRRTISKGRHLDLTHNEVSAMYMLIQINESVESFVQVEIKDVKATPLVAGVDSKSSVPPLNFQLSNEAGFDGVLVNVVKPTIPKASGSIVDVSTFDAPPSASPIRSCKS